MASTFARPMNPAKRRPKRQPVQIAPPKTPKPIPLAPTGGKPAVPRVSAPAAQAPPSTDIQSDQLIGAIGAAATPRSTGGSTAPPPASTPTPPVANSPAPPGQPDATGPPIPQPTTGGTPADAGGITRTPPTTNKDPIYDPRYQWKGSIDNLTRTAVGLIQAAFFDPKSAYKDPRNVKDSWAQANPWLIDAYNIGVWMRQGQPTAKPPVTSPLIWEVFKTGYDAGARGDPATRGPATGFLPGWMSGIWNAGRQAGIAGAARFKGAASGGGAGGGAGPASGPSLPPETPESSDARIGAEQTWGIEQADIGRRMYEAALAYGDPATINELAKQGYGPAVTEAPYTGALASIGRQQTQANLDVSNARERNNTWFSGMHVTDRDKIMANAAGATTGARNAWSSAKGGLTTEKLTSDERKRGILQGAQTHDTQAALAGEPQPTGETSEGNLGPTTPKGGTTQKPKTLSLAEQRAAKRAKKAKAKADAKKKPKKGGK